MYPASCSQSLPSVPRGYEQVAHSLSANKRGAWETWPTGEILRRWSCLKRDQVHEHLPKSTHASASRVRGLSGPFRKRGHR